MTTLYDKLRDELFHSVEVSETLGYLQAAQASDLRVTLNEWIENREMESEMLGEEAYAV